MVIDDHCNIVEKVRTTKQKTRVMMKRTAQAFIRNQRVTVQPQRFLQRNYAASSLIVETTTDRFEEDVIKSNVPYVRMIHL
jgi:hypothetical protein